MPLRSSIGPPGNSGPEGRYIASRKWSGTEGRGSGADQLEREATPDAEAGWLTAAMGTSALGGGLRPGKKCGGVAQVCNFFRMDPSGCQAAGCTTSGTCGGGPPLCNFETDQATCVRGGCTWNGTACTGTPTKCSDLTTMTSCRAAFDCFWVGQCSGSVPTCASLSAAKCGMQSGCYQQDAP
jgi:hypothetical protein